MVLNSLKNTFSKAILFNTISYSEIAGKILTQTKPPDTHIHASQLPNSGLFGETTLLDWLNKYTFPLESSLSSPTKARKVYSRCVARTLSHGTTTAAYYATTHAASTNILASICHSKGQRAFIGRCCMDSNINPSYYRDASVECAIEDTKATIDYITSLDPSHTLISPIITPRFAPSCTPSLLSRLGVLAAQTRLPIQTHISENPDEIALVAKLFPTYSSYAAVYDAFDLLTSRTVLAHAVHLKPEERQLIKQRGASVSHCPISNSALSSGICPVRELLDDGIVVGLGSDVSGGWSPSILVAAREASIISRVLAAVERDSKKSKGVSFPPENVPHVKDPHSPTTAIITPSKTRPTPSERKKLTVAECLYLATVGGATCLGLESKIGRFAVGMEWDAQLIALDHLALNSDDFDEFEELEEDISNGKGDLGPAEIWGHEDWADKVAKWVFCGDERNLKRVFVRGRMVFER